MEHTDETSFLCGDLWKASSFCFYPFFFFYMIDTIGFEHMESAP
jgi:hypothetical protein